MIRFNFVNIKGVLFGYNSGKWVCAVTGVIGVINVSYPPKQKMISIELWK